MKKVLIRLFVVFCLTLSMVIVAPFHIVSANDVYVEDWGINNVIGCIAYNNSTQAENNSVSYNTGYFRVVFDDHYVGKAEIKVQYKIVSNNNYYNRTQTVSFNGTYVDIPWTAANQQIYVPTEPTVQQVTPIGNVYKYTDFVNIFPYESMNFILDIVDRGFEIVDFYHLGSYMYPIFKVNSGDEIISRYLQGNTEQPNNKYVTVMWANANMNDVTTFNNVFQLRNCAVTDITTLNTFAYQGASTRIIKFTIYNNTGSTGTCRLYANQDMYIMPIYNKRLGEVGYETQDFCDNFGLPYNGLDSEQQQSAADLQDEQSEFGQSADELYTYENDFNESLNDSLDDINVNFDIGNTFGSKFLASASWVRQQFDALTSSSPFGSVLSFSLVLGIALLVIGKAIK